MYVRSEVGDGAGDPEVCRCHRREQWARKRNLAREVTKYNPGRALPRGSYVGRLTCRLLIVSQRRQHVAIRRALHSPDLQ